MMSVKSSPPECSPSITVILSLNIVLPGLEVSHHALTFVEKLVRLDGVQIVNFEMVTG